MGAALLLILQATAAAAPPARLDLMRAVAESGCDEPRGDAIVVCGRRADRYRLPPSDARFEKTSPLKAEVGIPGGGAALAAEASAVAMPGGLQSNRIMVRLKTPF